MLQLMAPLAAACGHSRRPSAPLPLHPPPASTLNPGQSVDSMAQHARQLLDHLGLSSVAVMGASGALAQWRAPLECSTNQQRRRELHRAAPLPPMQAARRLPARWRRRCGSVWGRSCWCARWCPRAGWRSSCCQVGGAGGVASLLGCRLDSAEGALLPA